MNKSKITKNEKSLIKLLESFIESLDRVMKQPSLIDRGGAIARIINSAELKKDLIKQNLNLPLRKL